VVWYVHYIINSTNTTIVATTYSTATYTTTKLGKSRNVSTTEINVIIELYHIDLVPLTLLTHEIFCLIHQSFNHFGVRMCRKH